MQAIGTTSHSRTSTVREADELSSADEVLVMASLESPRAIAQ